MIKSSDSITDLSKQQISTKVGFVPETAEQRKIISAAAKYCKANNLLDRRCTLEAKPALRQDQQPVYLYRHIYASELTSLLQKGFHHAIYTPTAEKRNSFLGQIESAIFVSRKIKSDNYLSTPDQFQNFFIQAGIKNVAQIMEAIKESDVDRLRQLIQSEFSPYERACIQKLPDLSGLNGFFSTSVIPSDSDLLVDGYCCYVEIAVPAERMMPPGLKDYLIPESKFKDGEVEVGLEYYTLDEVSKFFFRTDDMLTDSEMFERLKIPEAPGVRSRLCPFAAWRSSCNFLDYLPAEMLASPQRWIENLN
jgi:hypothetical protein